MIKQNDHAFILNAIQGAVYDALEDLGLNVEESIEVLERCRMMDLKESTNAALIDYRTKLIVTGGPKPRIVEG
jgi:hypothetical protein